MTYAPVRALKVIWRAYTAKKKKVEALSLFAMAAELFELYKPPQTKLDLLIRGPVIRGVAARVVAWEQPGKYSRMHRAGAAAVIKLNRWMDGFAARSGAELVGVLLRIMPTSSSASFSARTANSNECRQGLHIDSYPNSKALAACAAGAAPPTMYRTIISFIPNSSEKAYFVSVQLGIIITITLIGAVFTRRRGAFAARWKTTGIPVILSPCGL
jgi:hypothetical protein